MLSPVRIRRGSPDTKTFHRGGGGKRGLCWFRLIINRISYFHISTIPPFHYINKMSKTPGLLILKLNCFSTQYRTSHIRMWLPRIRALIGEGKEDPPPPLCWSVIVCPFPKRDKTIICSISRSLCPKRAVVSRVNNTTPTRAYCLPALLIIKPPPARGPPACGVIEDFAHEIRTDTSSRNIFRRMWLSGSAGRVPSPAAGPPLSPPAGSRANLHNYINTKQFPNVLFNCAL